MRLFLAFPLPDDVLDRIEEVQAEVPFGRPVPRENLHLTLSFLGELDRPEAEALHDGLCRIAVPAIAVDFEGLGTFGRPVPSILFAAVAGNAALTSLHRKLRATAHAAGIMPDRERFRPHVTLVRFCKDRRPDDAAVLARFLSVWGAVRLPGFVAEGFSLVESHLARGVPSYEDLATYRADTRGR
jgi:2'-5' RNA ligase